MKEGPTNMKDSPLVESCTLRFKAIKNSMKLKLTTTYYVSEWCSCGIDWTYLQLQKHVGAMQIPIR